MEIISKEEVMREMGAVPGPLLCDFYVKEVIGNERIYHPIKSSRNAKFSH